MKRISSLIVLSLVAICVMAAGETSATHTFEVLNTDSFKEKVWNFDECPYLKFKDAEKGAIIDFYADWCGPCKLLTPELEAVQAIYGDCINFYKVNIDKEGRELGMKFKTNQLPTLFFIPAGAIGNSKIHREIGWKNKRELAKIIEQYIVPSLPNRPETNKKGK